MNQITSKNSGLPIIGENIPWEMMYGGYCRVTKFTPFARVIKEQSQSFKVVGQVPYASLAIEILIDYEHPFTSGFLFLPKDSALLPLPKEVGMPVWNRVDFINLWEVFRETKGTVRALKSKEAEVIVEYASNQAEFDPDNPSLNIKFCEAGYLDDMVFPPPDTTYPRDDGPKVFFEWDENKEEFTGTLGGAVLRVLTHTNHIYGSPFLRFQGYY